MGVSTAWIPATEPFDGGSVLGFLEARAVAGLEEVKGGSYRRSVSLKNGGGHVSVRPESSGVRVELDLEDTADADEAARRVGRLFDVDADPSRDRGGARGRSAARAAGGKRPGLRVPGAMDGFELAVRAIVGQQVSVAGARTVLGRLVREHGGFPTRCRWRRPIPAASRSRARGERPSWRSPGWSRPGSCGSSPMRTQRRRAPGSSPYRGIGPWTASYIAMRALGDRDVFLPGDVGVRRGLAALGGDPDPDRWRPWRSYAVDASLATPRSSTFPRHARRPDHGADRARVGPPGGRPPRAGALAPAHARERRGDRRARRRRFLPRGAPDARRVPDQARPAVRAGQRGGGRRAQRARGLGPWRATAWRAAACWARWAEVAVAPDFLTFELSDELDFAQGAGLILNYHTAYFSLKHRGRLAEGETVLVHGAAGGIGTATLQVAKGLGARTIAVVSSDDKERIAREAGADEVRALRRRVEGRGEGAVGRRCGHRASTPWAATASPTACGRCARTAGSWWWASPAARSPR